MNTFVLEERVTSSINGCIERNDPNHTRDVIEKLLKDGSPKTLETLCLIVREIGVASLHGANACSYAASFSNNKTHATPNNSASKKPQVSPTYQKSHNLSPTIEGLSRLGTVALPKVIDYVEDVSDSDDSASDIPSQSSESSDDEHNSEDDAEEEWKQVLPHNPQTPEKSHSALKQQTHQDFFQALANDVEAITKKWKSPGAVAAVAAVRGSASKGTTPEKHVVVVEEPEEIHHQVHLPHSHLLSSTATPGLEEQIQIAIRSALTVTENFSTTTHLSISDDTSALYFSAELLDEISRSVIYHIGLTGEFADKCEGRITETLLIFVGYHVNGDNCDLLGAVIKSVIEKQLDKYQFELDGAEEGAGDGGDEGEGEEEEAEPVDQLSEAVHRVESHGTTGSPKAHHNNPADLILRQHERDLNGLDDTDVFRYIQRTASHHLEMNDPNPLTPSVNTNARSIDSANIPRVGEFNDELDTEIYEGSESDEDVQEDSEDSDSNGTQEEVKKGGPVEGESVPAWLLPKSPMDAVFKKGYGGLGHPDLVDVVARLASTPDKPLRAYNDSSSEGEGDSQDEDVREVRDLDRYGDHQGGQSSSDEAGDDDDEDDEDDEEEDRPALTIDDLPQRLGNLSAREQKSLHEAMREYLRRQQYEVPGDDEEEDEILASDPDEETETVSEGENADRDGIDFDDSGDSDSDEDSDDDEEEDGLDEDDSQLARDEEEVNEIIRRYMENTEQSKKIRAINAALDAEDDEYVIEDYVEEEEEEEEEEEQSRDEMNEDDDSTDAVMDLLNDSISSNQLLSFGLPVSSRSHDSDSSGGRPQPNHHHQQQQQSQARTHVLSQSGGITADVIDEKKFLLDKLRVLSRSKLSRSPPKVIRKAIEKPTAAPQSAAKSSPSKVSPGKSPRKQAADAAAAAAAELAAIISDDHLHPQSHQSTSLQYNADGSVKLTKSPALNKMLIESYRGTMQQYQKLDHLKKSVEAQKQHTSPPTRLFTKRSASSNTSSTAPSDAATAGSVSPIPQSPTRETPDEYTIEQLDALIKTNLARLESLKSPQGKVPPRSPGGTLTNNLSHVQPSVFQFANQLNMSEDNVLGGSISKSWDSPRKNSSNDDVRPVSRKSRPHPGTASKPNDDPFPSAVVGSAEKKKRTIDINLTASGNFGAASVGNTTTTSAAVVGVKPARTGASGGAGGKRPVTRSHSGDILLSMDSSIESDEGDYELPGKTKQQQKQRTPSSQQKKLTRRMSNGSNTNQHAASKERSSAVKVTRGGAAGGSLHAPTVAATMRSLAVAGNSSDAKIKQQCKIIHKSVVQDDSKPNPKKKRSTK